MLILDDVDFNDAATLAAIDYLLDTLLCALIDGDLADYPNLEATTRAQFARLGVAIPTATDEEENTDDDAE